MASQDANAQVKDVLDKSDKVMVCVNNRSSMDTHLAAGAFLLHVRALGKNAQLYVNGELISRHKDLYEEFGVDYEMDFKPMNYVITIDHSGGDIEKVSYDDKDGKFRLYITPAAQSNGFDFDKVSYSQGGGEADAVFSFGARSLNWLGSIYDENKELFEKAPVVNINNLHGTQEFGSVQIVDTDLAVSEMVYALMEGSRTLSDKKISSMLLMGILDKMQLLQMSDYKISTMETLTALVRMGADLKDSVQKLYFEKTLGNFEVERRVMGAAKYDTEQSLIWSSVSAFDLTQAGVSRDDFVLDGRIVCNMCKDFNVAFVLYEVQEGEIVVELESNVEGLDAKDLVSDYKVSGNSGRVFFTVRDKSLPDLEKEMVENLSGRVKLAEQTPVRESGQREERSEESRSEKQNEEEGSGQVVPDEPAQSGPGLVQPPPISPDES